jgi:hypothetical protein
MLHFFNLQVYLFVDCVAASNHRLGNGHDENV